MKSLAQKIAFQFFFVLALLVTALSFGLVFFIGQNIRKAKDREIFEALEIIQGAVQGEYSIYDAESDLPYYITYTVYDKNTQEISATNAPFIPILPPAPKKPVSYTEKEFFTDGDLNIFYETGETKNNGTDYVIQISYSVDQDELFNAFKIFSPEALAGIFIPLLGVTYLAAFIIAKRTLKPIVKMTQDAASISSSNLDAMLYVSSQHNELDALADTFNELFRRLKQDFIAVNAANKAKSSFLSNMSHEIRTPINAVLGLDEMILRESTEPEIQEYARDIQSSGKSLLSIINDILDFSKIEAGKMEIIPVDYDLSTLITDLVNMIEGRAHDKNLDFIVNVDPTIPHRLHGDETRIKQCILNILTNAVKYTRRGSVTMNIGFEKSLDPTDKNTIYLKAQVIDTGIGIKEDDLKKLFSPFERIEERRNRSIEGTGLGMSIVKNLLSAMGSRLEVKSEYGKGSDFSFTLEQEVIGWEEIGDYREMKKKNEENAQIYKESFQAPDANILVVDDTPLNLTVIKGLLKASRIQIDTAENGSDALKMAREKPYDILFIDHRMPKMDGIEMLHVLRYDESSKNQHTTCIALTANAISGAREMYIESGFQDYLSKPVESAALEAMLVKYLPGEKVLHEGDEGFVLRNDSDWNGIERRKHATVSKDALEAVNLWQEIFGTDILQAVHNCGSAQVFMEAARNFYEAIEEKSAQIEAFKKDANWNDYTVLVHALKSSARLIGASDLSEKAAFLEKCGDEAKIGDKEAINLISEKTGEVLAIYRSYSEKLAPLFGISAKTKNLPEIKKQTLEEAYSALKEVVSVFDFDSADSIIAELENYSVPQEESEKFEKLKKAVQSVDQTAVMKLLS